MSPGISSTQPELTRTSPPSGRRASAPAPIRKTKHGFSLVEVLVVMVLLGMLTSAVIPAFNTIAGGQGFTGGVYEAEGLLEYARGEAIARQTYVWVGFQTVQTADGSEIQMAAVASKDGSGTNTADSNLVPCGRLLHLKNARLADWQALKSATRTLLAGTNATPPASVANNTNGLPFTIGRAQFTNGYTITFTPRGEALLKGAAGSMDGYDSLIDVSFRRARGTAVASDAEDAAILIQGSTGSLRTLRL